MNEGSIIKINNIIKVFVHQYLEKLDFPHSFQKL